MESATALKASATTIRSRAENIRLRADTAHPELVQQLADLEAASQSIADRY